MKIKNDYSHKRNWAQILFVSCALVTGSLMGKGCSEQQSEFIPQLDRLTLPRTQQERERLRYHAAMCRIQAHFLEQLPTKKQLVSAMLHNRFDEDAKVSEINALKMDIACLDLAQDMGLPLRSTELFYNQEAALEESKMTLYTFAEHIQSMPDKDAGKLIHAYRRVALRGMRLALEYNQKVLSDRQRDGR